MIYTYCALVLCLAGAFASAQTISCSIANNYGGSNGLIYNTACPPERPYCTGSGLCSECAAGKDSLCDCPLNYKCAAARFNQWRNADFCTPMPLTVIDGACTDANQCAVPLVSKQSGLNETAFFTSCADSVCRYCIGGAIVTFTCTQGEVPGGNDARKYGSKSNGRICTSLYDAWNTNTRTLNPALPTDPFEYERNQYPAVSASQTLLPSPSRTAYTTPNPTAGSTGTTTPTPSLTLGATPSVSPDPVLTGDAVVHYAPIALCLAFSVFQLASSVLQLGADWH